MGRKACSVLAVMVISCLLNTSNGFSWGSLTHAYITSRFITGNEAVRGNAIYGSTAPDFPFAMPTSEIQGHLIGETHWNFSIVWEMAEDGPSHSLERAVALGFIAHNDEDYTAHYESQALDPRIGYVAQKAIMLDYDLTTSGVWERLGVDSGNRGGLAHGIIEFAGDYLVATQLDRAAGRLLYTAASDAAMTFQELLCRAYVRMHPHGAIALLSVLIITRPIDPVVEGEFLFRRTMASYGRIFSGNGRNDILLDLPTTYTGYRKTGTST